jgi:hypothetical protein
VHAIDHQRFKYELAIMKTRIGELLALEYIQQHKKTSLQYVTVKDEEVVDDNALLVYTDRLVPSHMSNKVVFNYRFGYDSTLSIWTPLGELQVYQIVPKKNGDSDIAGKKETDFFNEQVKTRVFFTPEKFRDIYVLHIVDPYNSIIRQMCVDDVTWYGWISGILYKK